MGSTTSPAGAVPWPSNPAPTPPTNAAHADTCVTIEGHKLPARAVLAVMSASDRRSTVSWATAAGTRSRLAKPAGGPSSMATPPARPPAPRASRHRAITSLAWARSTIMAADARAPIRHPHGRAMDLAWPARRSALCAGHCAHAMATEACQRAPSHASTTVLSSWPFVIASTSGPVNAA